MPSHIFKALLDSKPLKDLSLIPQNISESKLFDAHNFLANARISSLSILFKKLMFDAFNKSLYNWIFSPAKIDFDDFIRNDDITFYYHLIRWKDESFEPLSTLCKMFIERDLLKASDITFLSNIDRLEILAFAKKLCETNNYDSAIFCGIKERSFKGFESNNSLKIWDGTYQNSLENSSALIKTLMKSEESSFIIYPGAIKNEITNKISLIRNNS